MPVPAPSYFHGLLSRPSCEMCPLRYSTKVFPDGPVPARIAFVGEGPGRQEEEQGKGFVGPTGQILWRLCERHGLTREQVWVSNAALCRPKDIRLSTGAVIPMPRVKQLSADACRSRLLEEMLRIQPVVVVAIGGLALQSVTRLVSPSIFAYRGSRIDTDFAELLESWRAALAAGGP